MAKRELRSAWYDIGAVMDDLPDGVDVESVKLSEMGVGQTRAIITLRNGIEKAAEAFKITGLGAERSPATSGLEAVYFAVGGVSIVQYRRGGAKNGS